EKPEVVEHLTQMILQTDPEGAAAAQRGMAERPDYSDDLSAIRVPTLIVVGREDQMRTPQDAEFLEQKIPDARVEIIERAGHLMNMEQPAVFNQILISFLRESTKLARGDAGH